MSPRPPFLAKLWLTWQQQMSFVLTPGDFFLTLLIGNNLQAVLMTTLRTSLSAMSGLIS